MKFFFGVLVGATLGVLTLVGTVTGFVGGLVLGWQLFSSDDEEPTTPDEESTPRTGPDMVPYERMEPRPATGQGEVSAA